MIADLHRNSSRVLSNIDPRHGSSAFDLAPLAGLAERTVARHLSLLDSDGLVCSADIHSSDHARVYQLTDRGLELQDQLNSAGVR